MGAVMWNCSYTLPQEFDIVSFVLTNAPPRFGCGSLIGLRSTGGMALLNVHPDYIRFPGERVPTAAANYTVELYENFLRQVSERYAKSYWAALPRQVAAWYKESVASKPFSAIASQPATSVPASRSGIAITPDRKAGRAAVVVYANYESDARPMREAEALVQAGYETDVVALRADESYSSVELIKGVKVHRVPLSHKRGGRGGYLVRYGRFFLSSFFRLTAWTLRGDLKVVHIHNMPDFLVFSAIVPRLAGAKIILDLHDPMPELYASLFEGQDKEFACKVLLWLERWSIAFADKVLTPNVAFKKLFVSRGGDPEKIEIIMNSPDVALFDAKKHQVSAGEPQRRYPLP